MNQNANATCRAKRPPSVLLLVGFIVLSIAMIIGLGIVARSWKAFGLAALLAAATGGLVVQTKKQSYLVTAKGKPRPLKNARN